MFAKEIRRSRIGGLKISRWQWHLDEVFVKINAERQSLSQSTYKALATQLFYSYGDLAGKPGWME